MNKDQTLSLAERFRVYAAAGKDVSFTPNTLRQMANSLDDYESKIQKTLYSIRIACFIIAFLTVINIYTLVTWFNVWPF